MQVPRIVGLGQSPVVKLKLPTSQLIKTALHAACKDAGFALKKLDGIIAVPSLSHPRFMEAHCIATEIGLLPGVGVVARTVDTGGAGPITALLMADRMIKYEDCEAVAIVAGDAIASLDSEEFIRRADSSFCQSDGRSGELFQSPVIPNAYNRVAEWKIQLGLLREQLAMTAVLMSRLAVRHPMAATKRPLSLTEVLTSKSIASVTTIKECARKVDGGSAIILASEKFIKKNNLSLNKLSSPKILGGGEASGPILPPLVIDESFFSCHVAAERAYRASGLSVENIDFFGLYDCFPICFIQAVEAVGLAPKHGGGKWVQNFYDESELLGGSAPSPDKFPVNTHGGLLGFGTPWEGPAMYSVIEACQQMNRSCGERQIKKDVKTALVYGNGGIFSASAIAILGR